MIRINKNKGLSKSSLTIIIFDEENPKQPKQHLLTHAYPNTTNANKYIKYDRKFPFIITIQKTITNNLTHKPTNLIQQ